MNLSSPEQPLQVAPESKPDQVALKQNLIRMAGFMGAAFMLAACSPHPDINTATAQATSTAAAPHAQDQSAENTRPDLEPLDHIKQRLGNGVLNRWVEERGFLQHFDEWNARREIADKINEDLNHPQEKVINLKDALNEIEKASLQMKKTNTNKLIIQTKDSITGEPGTTEVTKDDDGKTWTTQELRPDGSIISKAVVNIQTGQTSLTLDFKGERYQNANPHLINDPRFPKATIKTFSLSTEAVVSNQGKN